MHYRSNSRFPNLQLNEYQRHVRDKATSTLSAARIETLQLNLVMSYANEKEKKEFEGLKLDYAEERGSVRLRKSIAAQYPNLNEDQILVFTGAQEAIFCAMNATITAESRCGVVTPAYESLLEIPKTLGAEIIPISLKPQHDGWMLDTGPLRKNHLENPFSNLILNFPHNPTGALLSLEILEEVIDLSSNTGTWIINDEVFRGLEHDSKKRLPPIASLTTRGISIGSVSKPHGLGGLRIGWLACQDSEFLEQALFFKQSLSVCSSSIDDWLASLVVKNSSLLRHRAKLIALENLDFINQCIEKTNTKLNWIAPSAGCVAFPSLREDIPVTELADSLLQKHKIMLIPGECFSQSPINHFRLGYGQQNFKEVFNTFCNFLEMNYR